MLGSRYSGKVDCKVMVLGETFISNEVGYHLAGSLKCSIYEIALAILMI